LPLSHALFQTGPRRGKGNAGDRPMMSNCIRSVAPVMTTPAEKGLSLLDTPGIISFEPINRDHWASLRRANGDLVRNMRRVDRDPCPSCLKTIDERGGQEWRKTVTLREAQRLNSTHTCSVVVPGCPDNIFLTGHTPPSRRPFLEEVDNDRGKYPMEFNVNAYLILV